MTIVPPRVGSTGFSAALTKWLEKTVPDAANPRGKTRAVRREILFEGTSSTKVATPTSYNAAEAIGMPRMSLAHVAWHLSLRSGEGSSSHRSDACEDVEP